MNEDCAVTPGTHIAVREVGPRDGFQNAKRFIPTDQKVAIINGLVDAGLHELQVTSFVSPRTVPQMADADHVLAGIDRSQGAHFVALVPNARGAERAAAARADLMEVFCSATETHNRKNVNMSIRDSLRGFRDVVRIAAQAGIEVNGTIATSFGCPFEGDVPPAQVLSIAKAFCDLGVKVIILGDTTGMATPPTMRSVLEALRGGVPDVQIGLHLHNTRGIGLANVLVGFDEGIRRYDASIGGLGGCPFVAGATGNNLYRRPRVSATRERVRDGHRPEQADQGRRTDRAAGRARPARPDDEGGAATQTALG